MGLAASQARFLAITSRKMNCEFQSMQIAQQKLSVTRDLQKAAQDYQNSLSATKLVWDCDTVDNDIYDLSYYLMMNPSAINEYDPYLITDSRGKIVLDNKTWDAAVKAGIIDVNTGDPKGVADEATRNKFLDALGAAGVAKPSVIKAVKSLGSEGYTASGIGGEILDKTIANIMNTTAFINYMKSATYSEDVKDDKGKVIHKAGDLIYSVNLTELNRKDEKGTAVTVPQSTRSSLGFDKKENDTYIISNKQSVISSSASDKMTLGDIISGQYSLSYKGSKDDFREILEDVLKKIIEPLGYGSKYTDNPQTGLCVTDEAQIALGNAYELTLKLFNSNDDFIDGDSSNVGKNVTSSQDYNTGVGSDKLWSISISNMLNSFLTNFVVCLEGFDCGLNTDKTKKDSNYVTKYLDYNFQLSNEAFPEEAMLYADFYNQLFNQICMNGACNDQTKREKVTDKSYLANALKNAQLFVSTLNTDGYFYQGHYTASDHIAEVADEDAIARAEVEYNVTKSKLNHKEETLELQMKNLDMEISSLTSEYDTVKGLISKGVEKVFTMFSS